MVLVYEPNKNNVLTYDPTSFLHFRPTSYPPIPEPHIPLTFIVLSIMKYLVIFTITNFENKVQRETFTLSAITQREPLLRFFRFLRICTFLKQTNK